MKLRNFLLGTLCLSLTSTAWAGFAVLDNGLYRLGNHPDGSARPPLYGLRLDGLDGSNRDYTFDFEDDANDSADNGAGMFMQVNLDMNNMANSSIRIYGQVYGGRNAGSGYDSVGVGLWQIDFTYGANLQVGGNGRIFVSPQASADNNGFIKPLFSDSLFDGSSIGLWDYITGGQGETFILNTGHRGYAGISGWGWLSHGTEGNHVDASDWLFTVNQNRIPVVPVPGAGLLGVIGLSLVGYLKRQVN